MKKYTFCYPKSAYVVCALILVAAAAGIVFASLRLAEVAGFLSAFPAIDVMTILFFAVFSVGICWLLFGSYYAFVGEHFVVARLFFRHRIDRDALVKFVVEESSGLAVLYFLQAEQGETLSFVTVNLRRKEVDPFIASLRAFKPEIPVEVDPIPKEE